jgi:undecaprenyl diphosphate synthase
MAVQAGSQNMAVNSESPSGSPPRHVGIIMDGNGRWATARGLPRAEGHRRGIEAARSAVRAAKELGVEVLTLFCFSSENWSRPPREVDFLLTLLRAFVRRDLAELAGNGVRVRIIGERQGIPGDLAELLAHAESLTRNNHLLQLVIAFNYGGRDEIVRAVRRLASDVLAGRLAPELLDAGSLAERLDTAGLPDPDLIIRTGGEMRLSNFLLWQAAYSELVFLPMHWPEFDRAAFRAAIAEYGERDRRFGGIVAKQAP